MLLYKMSLHNMSLPRMSLETMLLQEKMRPAHRCVAPRNRVEYRNINAVHGFWYFTWRSERPIYALYLRPRKVLQGADKGDVEVYVDIRSSPRQAVVNRPGPFFRRL
ncbi:hypothetical protein PMIN04_004910 [Paraphaeosphaeria minitans]